MPDCWRGTYRRQGEERTRQGEEGGRKVYSHALAKTLSPANLLQEWLREILQVQRDRNFSQIVASSPDHSNTDKSNSVAGLDPVSFTSTHCYRQSFRDILVKTTARQISTLEAHRRLGKQTQRHRGVQSAEWRCNLSSKVSRLFLPVLFSAVRDVPLADAGGSCLPVLAAPGWGPRASHGRCSGPAVWPPWWACRCCC